MVPCCCRCLTCHHLVFWSGRWYCKAHRMALRLRIRRRKREALVLAPLMGGCRER